MESLMVFKSSIFILISFKIYLNICPKINENNMKNENEKYCTECGAIINSKAEICPKCGVRQPYTKNQDSTGQKDNNRWKL